MTEFELIRRYFAAQTSSDGVVLGVGDDCALLQPPPGEQLAVTHDTLVAGRHYPFETAPDAIGWKALAVNLSDLAAMGAQPRWFLLSLTLEQAEPAWLEAFARGLHGLARQHGIALVGGDTTRGPQAIGITAIGSLPPDIALRRDGARAGDAICVTGTLGDAALALQRLAQSGDDDAALRERLDRPQPRVQAGLALRGLATAAIDLSDGLVGDLAHVLAASGVGARLDAGALPMSAAFERLHPPSQRLQLQAGGGDDYELCVCIPPQQLAEAQRRLHAMQLQLSCIGEVDSAPGLRWQDGLPAQPFSGYQHFG